MLHRASFFTLGKYKLENFMVKRRYFCYGLCFYKLAIMILGNTVLNFCVRLFIIHCKLIRFKTSFITGEDRVS